ncbi:MAG: YraN family protein [Ruminococcaceae bacterium]|nr:YraN family protein [Oscillospiraceae bacterium]MBE6706136.1 YraN family protein [Oscillospiraceae bacterium]
MSTIEIGKFGEDSATSYLKKNGYRIVDRNVHVSHNEIDIIARDKTYLVFVEVKTRSTDNSLYSDYGTPASAVTRSKQLRTLEAARKYLATTKYSRLQPRFDVLEIYIDKNERKVIKINHITNAFGA